MIKKNLGVLGKLLVVMVIYVVIAGILAYISVDIVGKRMILIQICDYIFALVFAAICSCVLWKSENIRYCGFSVILGIVIFGYGIYDLILYEMWLNAVFITCMIFSVGIFLGVLFKAIKKN